MEKNGARRFDQVIQIDGFEYDDLKLEFETGRTSKTISLRNVEQINRDGRYYKRC